MKANAHPRLAGQVILVTGAWGGLGRTFVRHLLASRAKVILSDVSERPLAELADGGVLGIDHPFSALVDEAPFAVRFLVKCPRRYHIWPH